MEEYYSALIKTLGNWTTDWDGSLMSRDECPRDGMHCDVLYDAIAAIDFLAKRVDELERQNDNLRDDLVHAGDESWS